MKDEEAAVAGGKEQVERQRNERRQTLPKAPAEKKNGGSDLKTVPPSRRQSKPSQPKQEVNRSEQN